MSSGNLSLTGTKLKCMSEVEGTGDGVIFGDCPHTGEEGNDLDNKCYEAFQDCVHETNDRKSKSESCVISHCFVGVSN